MPYNGSGSFTPDAADFPAVAGTIIESSKFNNVINGISTGLSTAITKDGQTTITGDIPFSGKKITGLGNGTADQDATTYVQLTSRTVVSVKDPAYGAVGDGVANDTAAIQAAIDSGAYSIFVPIGTYLIDTVYFKNQAIEFVGASMAGVIFQGRTANTVLFQKVASAGVSDGSLIGNFSVKPHASGSTTGAIKCTGFRNSTFDRIAGLSNGTAGFASLYDIAAHPYLCYSNTWSNATLNGQDGWTKVFNFNNNSQGVAYNCNAGLILTPWIVDNTADLTLAIDAVRSAKIQVLGGLIENNPGCTAISPGQAMNVKGAWFELNAADFVMEAPEAGSAAVDVIVEGNYFSQAHTISMLVAEGVVWRDNTEAGVQTWSNNDYGVNFKQKQPKSAITAPALSYTSGEAGALALVVKERAGKFQPDRLMFRIVYTWAATTATTQTSFTLAAVSGYTIINATPSAIRGSTGEPAKIGNDATLGKIWLQNQYNDSHTITILAEYQLG